ncbi:MAG TPA: peptidase M50 [Firmicutes bacterium]|nr:peptidase M50 [Bacillota bacterium]
MKSEKLIFDRSFYFMCLLVIFTGRYTEWVIFMISIFFHECGHILMAKVLKWELKEVRVFGFGGFMQFTGELNKSNREDLLISMSGIAVNILILCLLCLIPKQFLTIRNLRLQNMFIQAQLFIIVYNLIPLPPLDGNRILINLLSMIFPYKRVLKLNSWISFIILGAILCLTFYYDFRQYYMAIGYVLFSTIKFVKQAPYLYQRFILQKVNAKNTGLSTKTSTLINEDWESVIYKGYNNQFFIRNKKYDEQKLLKVKYEQI